MLCPPTFLQLRGQVSHSGTEIRTLAPPPVFEDQPPRVTPWCHIPSPPCVLSAWAKHGHQQWISQLWGWEGKPWPQSRCDGTSLAAGCSIFPACLPVAPPGHSSQASVKFPAVRWWHPTAFWLSGVYCLFARGKSLCRASKPGSGHASSPCRHWCPLLHRKAQSQEGWQLGTTLRCRWQLYMAPFGEISNQSYHHPDVHSCADGYGERSEEESSAGS